MTTKKFYVHSFSTRADCFGHVAGESSGESYDIPTAALVTVQRPNNLKEQITDPGQLSSYFMTQGYLNVELTLGGQVGEETMPEGVVTAAHFSRVMG